MAIYLGNGGRLKININGVTYALHVPSFDKLPALSGVIPVTSDNYILTSYDGLYLTFKEDE